MTFETAFHATQARSYLFVPGDRPDRFQKAFDTEADAVILDLEDAVSPANKSAARDAIANFITPAHRGIIRINALDTAWAASDVELCRHPGVAAIMLPKTQSADDVAAVAARAGIDTAILALIETAQGVASVQKVSQAIVSGRLVFGSIDLQLDMEIDGDDTELLLFRSMLVLASRCANLPPPCDGVTPSLDDSTALEQDAKRGQRLGFGAKLCIHPKQIHQVNTIFSPGPELCAWAKRVLDASSRADGAATVLDGKMVDAPVVERARRILETSHFT